MKTIHTSPALGKRVFSGFAALAALFALAACGGGGGGSGPTAGTPPPAPAPAPTTPPAPAPAPAPSPAPAPAPAASATVESTTDCTIKLNEKTCNGGVVYTANNTVNATLNVVNQVSVPINNGTMVSRAVTLTGAGDWEVAIEDSSGKTLGTTKTIRSVCASGAVWDAAQGCVLETLRYSVILAVDGYKVGMPIRITGDSCATAKVEEAFNKTSFPEQPQWNFALFNAMIHKDILPSGRILVAQQVVADNNETRVFSYNAVTNDLVDYDGSEGPAPKYTPFAERDPGWQFQSIYNHPDPAIGPWAQNEKLLVYTPSSGAVSGTLFCEDVVNGQRSGSPVMFTLPEEYGTFFGFWWYKH